MRKVLLITILVSMAGWLAAAEKLYLVTCPTAGVLQRGEAEVSGELYRDNGMLAGAGVGLFKRFCFGVKYGGENITGDQNPDWHNQIGFNARLRVFEESTQMPALTVGVDTQGHGPWNDNRFLVKSKGFFAAVSHNYEFLGDLGLHAGINYSLENKDDHDPDGWVGVDKSIGDMIHVFAEYDPCFNDNQDTDFFQVAGHGWLNGGVSLLVEDNLEVKVLLYDLLHNNKDAKTVERAVQLSYRFSY